MAETPRAKLKLAGVWSGVKMMTEAVPFMEASVWLTSAATVAFHGVSPARYHEYVMGRPRARVALATSEIGSQSPTSEGAKRMTIGVNGLDVGDEVGDCDGVRLGEAVGVRFTIISKNDQACNKISVRCICCSSSST